MKALLVTKGLDGALEKMDDPHSAQARAQMCLCVSADYVNLVASAESAFHAWQALETINAGQTAARRLKLRKDLTNLKKEPKESMITYIMRGKQLGTSLRAIDESVSDANLIDSILSGLPPEYENKVDMLVTLGKLICSNYKINSFKLKQAYSPKKKILDKWHSQSTRAAQSLYALTVDVMDILEKNAGF